MLLPFYGYLVRPDAAAATIAPPYDTLSPEQRLSYAARYPDNFLNAIRSQQDFPKGQQPDQEELLARNAAWIATRINSGTYTWTPKVVLVYRLQSGNHSQTGIIGEVPIRYYQEDRIKPHELTNTTKQHELVRFLETIGIMSSPISCGYRYDARIDEWCTAITATAPYIDYIEPLHHTRHTIWSISDAAQLSQILSYVADINKVYITDGHHRCSSLQHASRASNDTESRLLMALFPDNQLRILPFHRYISGLCGVSPEQLQVAINHDFSVSPIDACNDPFPRSEREFTMRLQGRWWRLNLRQPLHHKTSLVDQIDASILQHKILQPLLGIENPRVSKRLSYVMGNIDQHQLAAMPHHDAVLFLLHPLTMHDVMRVADNNQTMLPKSTCFDPKLQSGFIISYPFKKFT